MRKNDDMQIYKKRALRMDLNALGFANIIS